MWFRKRKRRPKRRPDWFPIQLGTCPYTGANRYVPHNTLSIGALLSGSPGTGKSVAALGLAEQGIRGPKASQLFIDGKFDPHSSWDLPQGLMRAAHDAGLPFKFVNLTDPSLRVPTFAFNPLDMEFFQTLAPLHKAEFVIQSAGLLYGRDYGQSFYGGAIARVAIEIFQRYPRIRTFRQLWKVVNSLIGEKNLPGDLHQEFVRSGGPALENTLRALAELDFLNVTSEASAKHPFGVVDSQIDLASLLRSPGVVFVGCNVSVSPLLGPILMRLAVFAMSYSTQVIERGVPVWITVDEMPVAASYPWKERLNLLRGAGCGIIVTCQQLEDLVTEVVDLRPNVTALPLKWTFRIDDPAKQKQFSESSGHKVVHQRSFSGTYNLGGTFAVEKVNLNEQERPYLSQNDLKLVSADDSLSIFELRQDTEHVSYGGFPVLIRRIKRNDLAALRKPLPADYPGSFIPRSVIPNDDPEFVDRAGPVPPIHIYRGGDFERSGS